MSIVQRAVLNPLGLQGTLEHHVGAEDLGALAGGDAACVQGIVDQLAQALVVHEPDAAEDILEVGGGPLAVEPFQAVVF